MATFVKGDYVQVCPYPDYSWDQWSDEHNKLCKKTCKIIEVNLEQWTNQLFIKVEHRGEHIWFLDSHLIKVDNYEEVFQENIHEAVHQLNETERICKKLRDEILAEAFGCEPAVEEKEAEEKRLAEEAERKKREAEEAKRKAEEDAKRKAEEAKKKAEAAKKRKAAAKKKAQAQAKNNLPKNK